MAGDLGPVHRVVAPTPFAPDINGGGPVAQMLSDDWRAAAERRAKPDAPQSHTPVIPGEGGAVTRDRETENEMSSQNRGQRTPGLVVRLGESGLEVPLVVGPGEWKQIVGDPRSTHSIRLDCEAGRLPTLPRNGGSGSHHRIVVAKALDELGVAYQVVSTTI